MELHEIPMVRQMKGTSYYGEEGLNEWWDRHVGDRDKSVLCSTKKDGRFIQGYVIDKECFLITSGGLRLRIPHLEEKLLTTNNEYYFEAELIYGAGKLDTRDNTAVMATWIKNGIVSEEDFKDYALALFRKIRIYRTNGKITYDFNHPLILSKKETLHWLDYGDRIGAVPNYSKNYDSLLESFRALEDMGLEGLMVMPENLPYKCGKRLKEYGKLKPLHLVDVQVVDYLEGDGKYVGRIGSLVVCDQEGRVFTVAGISDSWRNIKQFHKIKGKELVVQFERFADTYVQPRIYKSNERRNK